MKVFIDACLLIYLNTLTNAYVRGMYENFYLNVLSKYKAFTDVLVLDELIYISEKKYNVPSSVTLGFIDSTVLSYVTILGLGEEEYRRAYLYIKEYGLKLSDALHLGAMKNNGIEYIASEDLDFDKVGEIKRVWLSSAT
ncbi:MAG: PIN domain nuclease [Candidatus Methanomethylicota archaeon]|uniref:PIN domain nuclease n=1 Tax=Thermoproteota archaeon TaxID=2056631 RepID=A0A497EM82_9CREN|nr:MAG: PIN domain nuclease [Candidatus Verstraetearchaeota archaeon]